VFFVRRSPETVTKHSLHQVVKNAEVELFTLGKTRFVDQVKPAFTIIIFHKYNKTAALKVSHFFNLTPKKKKRLSYLIQPLYYKI
jgi:hypothetical protein